MDDRRFDDLTRALATSRRGALKTLGGIAAGGLLALFDRVGGDAQQRPRRPRRPRPPRPPRSGGCATRQDFDRCAQCGICLGGRCIPDPSFCPGCRTCDTARLMCVQVSNGETCGNCGECQGGQCVNEGDCGDCGACEGGQCLPDNARCAEECELCVQTGRRSTCIQAEDGSTCGTCGICRSGACGENDCGECGECMAGTCVPRQDRCDPECEICDDETLTCDSTITEGLLCGRDCGVCRNGACVAESGRCAECEVCEEAFDTLLCLPAAGGFSCGGGECGACVQGECVPNDEACAECQFCNVVLACEPVADGDPCEGGTCQGGACVEQEICPPGLRRCGECCYDDRPPACEACEVVSDPSSPNGFGFECISTVPRMTERCATIGEQFGIGLGFNPALTCGACCALPGEPCITQTARYLCCSGEDCVIDPTINASICP